MSKAEEKSLSLEENFDLLDELVEKLSSNNFSKYFSILFDVYYRTANYYRKLNKNDLAEPLFESSFQIIKKNRK